MAYPQPIALADITPGMDVQAVVTWTATGASSASRGLISSSSLDHLGFSNGLSSPTENSAQTGTNVTYLLMSAPPATVPEPDNGTIVTDETGAAWQGLGGVWRSINGEQLSWADFLTAHPAYTTMQDSAVVPLPAPVSPYPQVIAPADVKIGMGLRVTLTYAEGGSKVVRGICIWTQDNDNTDGVTPDYLVISISTGDIFAYNPVPDGQTLTIEQMQAWTGSADWPTIGEAEPAIGTVIRDRSGIAWQRITDAAADDPNPGVTPGKGRWFNVLQGFPLVTVQAPFATPDTRTYTEPIQWTWLWGYAAPFNVQEPATP